MELAVHWHRCQNLPKKRVSTSLLYKERDDPVKNGLVDCISSVARTNGSDRFYGRGLFRHALPQDTHGWVSWGRAWRNGRNLLFPAPVGLGLFTTVVTPATVSHLDSMLQPLQPPRQHPFERGQNLLQGGKVVVITTLLEDVASFQGKDAHAINPKGTREPALP